MFIIPASVVAKIMMAVTISLHPAAHHAPASYTVHQGDTLSAIAARNYGNSADWPAVWWVNRHQVRNPNVLLVGERLRLPASGHVTAAMARAAQAAIPDPPPPSPASTTPVSYSQPDPSPLPHPSTARPRRRPLAGLTGTPSRRASPAGTGASAPATASTAGCSSRSRPGSATAAASTLRRRTWPPRPSRLPWLSG